MDPTITAILALSIIINIICTIACPIIASYKDRSVVGWLFGGLFLSLIGLIIISLLKPKEFYIMY